MKFMIVKGTKESQLELPVKAEHRLNRLRLALGSKLPMEATDVFVRDGKPVAAADEAEKTVQWLVGKGDVPVVTVRAGGKAGAEDPPPPPPADGIQVRIAVGTAAPKNVAIPKDTGDTAQALRTALQDAKAIEAACNFLQPDGTTLARREEAATKWKSLEADGRIALSAAEGKREVQTTTGNDRTTVSDGGQTVVKFGRIEFKLGPRETRTMLQYVTTADKLGQIVDGPVKNLQDKTVEERHAWLHRNGFFRALRVTPNEVTLSSRDVFRVTPESLEPEYLVPARKTVYRNTKAATTLERDVARIAENGGGGSVEGSYGGFSGQLTVTGGRKTGGRTTEGEATLHVSTSVLVTALQASFALENLELTPWAQGLVADCVRRLGGTATTLAADVERVLGLFDQIGWYFARTTTFGGKLSIDESVTRRTLEEVTQEALQIDAQAQVKYSSFFTIAAKGSYSHSSESFDAKVTTSENRSYTIEQYGGANGSLSDPARWCASLGDVDNLARILDFDLLPVAALLPVASLDPIMDVLTRGERTQVFQDCPANLSALVGWYQKQFMGELS